MSVLFQDEVKDVKLMLLECIKIKFKYISLDRLLKELKKDFCLAEWDEKSDYADCFHSFQNFLFKNNLTKYVDVKIKLGTFDFLVEYKSKARRLSVEVFLLIYSSVDIINIMYNIPAESLSVDELIYIRKVIQFDKKPIMIQNSGFFKEYVEFDKVTFGQISCDICKSLIRLSGYHRYAVKHRMNNLKKFKFRMDYNTYYTNSYEAMYKQKMMVVEVRRIDGMDAASFTSEEFNNRYAKMIYGMLVCDEGYRYVPHHCVSGALEDNFGSREHFRIYVSNIGVVVINLIHSARQLEYEEFQRQLGEEFEDEDSKKLFCSHPDYAGLEHGALLSLERVTILFVIINSNLKKEYFTTKNSVRKIIRNRQMMIDIVNLVMSFNISEITALTDIIMRKIGIFNYVDRVRERLDIAEDDTLIIYQKWNNILTLSIAILGIIFAAMSISEIKTVIIRFFDMLF